MILVNCNHSLKNGKGLDGIARQFMQVIPCVAVDRHRAASEPEGDYQSVGQLVEPVRQPLIRITHCACPFMQGRVEPGASAGLQIYLECVKDYVCRYTPRSMSEGVENVDFLPAQLFQSADIVGAD